MAVPTHNPASPEPWATTFTERLKRARLAAGVSAEEMGRVLECSERQIRNYENGTTEIKRKDARDWAMRCGGARVHHWITTGEIPDEVTDHGPDEGTSLVRCIRGPWLTEPTALDDELVAV